jgi:hypothetical protein
MATLGAAPYAFCCQASHACQYHMMPDGLLCQPAWWRHHICILCMRLMLQTIAATPACLYSITAVQPGYNTVVPCCKKCAAWAVDETSMSCTYYGKCAPIVRLKNSGYLQLFNCCTHTTCSDCDCICSTCSIVLFLLSRLASRAHCHAA